MAVSQLSLVWLLHFPLEPAQQALARCRALDGRARAGYTGPDPTSTEAAPMFRRNLTRQWQLLEPGVDSAAIHTPDQRPIAIAFATSLPTPQLEGIELQHRAEPYLFINGSGQNLYARAAYASGSIVEYLVGRGSATGQGANGLNAYEVFVQNGYDGTVDDWMAELYGTGGEGGGTGAVRSVAGRTGHVVLAVEDITSLSDELAAKADLADLAGKADLVSPVFTGVPRGPTPATGSRSTALATSAFVGSAVDAAIASIPTLVYPTRAAAGAATVPGNINAIQLQGFAAPGDRGDGLYRSVANEGTLQRWQFQSNGGTRRWELSALEVRPEMLGCVGGELTVALPYLQACVTYLGTRGGGTIYLSSGVTYTIQGTFQINVSKIILTGGGRLHRNDVPRSGQNVLFINDSSDIVIERIDITGNPTIRKQTDNAYGIVCHRCVNVRVEGCRVYDHGGMAMVFQQSLHVIVQDNFVYGCKSDGIHFTSGVRLSQIRGNTITSCGDDLISVTDDLPELGVRPYDIIVADNIVQGNTWASGIRVSHSDRVQVINNIIEDTSANGIILGPWNNTAASSDILILGNVVRRSGQIYSGAAGQNPEGFSVGQSYAHGIAVIHARICLIADNIVEDVTLRPNASVPALGICLDDNLVSTTVKGNMIYGCGRGIGTHNTEELPYVEMVDTTITANVLSQIAGEAIWFAPVGGNATGVIIQGNIINRGQSATAISVARTGAELLVVDGNKAPGKNIVIDRATCLNVELDGHSTGTWSPILRGSNGTNVGTYTASGTWVKVGSTVYVVIEWNITAVGGASGTLTIPNMPFARALPTFNLSGRIVTGGPTPLNYLIQGVGGVANPSQVNIFRADGSTFMAVQSANLAGSYYTNG